MKANLEHLEESLNQVLGWPYYAHEACRMLVWKSAGRAEIEVVCYPCKWKHSWALTAVLPLYREEAIEWLTAPLEAHRKDVVHKLNPTLADYTDWGWFHIDD